MKKRMIAVVLAGAVLMAGPACAKKNEDKLALGKLLQDSAHTTGVFRYSDETPASPFASGSLVQVRGLVEDDFRFKARLTVDGVDALDEVVNDDALAVRFLDPSYVSKFTGRGGEASTVAALSSRYWVLDPTGAPSIGDAAVSDRVIGVDPVVDALSVIDYAQDAISASTGVYKFNAERLDYRPLEDPFPRPAKGSGVTRWDLTPPPMPRADALETGQGNAALARAANFRQMAVYVKNGKVVQIREQIAAKFELLDKFEDYIIRYVEKNDEKAGDAIRSQIERVKDQEDLKEAFLGVALNQILVEAGEEPVRFRTMKYEFSLSDDVHADLPFGPEVRQGALDFFGVNAKADQSTTRRRVVEDPSSTTTSTP